LKRELVAHLRRSRSLRRPRTASRANRGQGQIVDGISIRERPAEAADRAIPGHWEGDLLAGAANSHIATLVERHSRFLMLIAVDGKDTRSVTSALSRQLSRLPQQLRSSLTWDRGMEMAEHARFTVATDVKVYFCDPQSPWQRGSNENTNGLPPPVLPERHRPLETHPTAARRDCRQAQHTTKTNPRLQNTSSYPQHSVALTG
jgi:IS30 family transposase